MENIVLSKEKFVGIISRLEAARRVKEQVDAIFAESRENLDNDFLNAALLQISHETIVVQLLEHIFCDETKEISFFVYDLDYGRKYYPGCETEGDGKIVDLSTAEKLYDVLITNMSLL